MDKVFLKFFYTDVVSNVQKWYKENTKNICWPVLVFYAG